jgi:hypothetical protein
MVSHRSFSFIGPSTHRSFYLIEGRRWGISAEKMLCHGTKYAFFCFVLP